jgi:ADP-heptose:LPS heptosyltransferase
MDRYVGTMLCGVAVMASKLRVWRRALDHPRTILVVKCLGLGSIALASRALHALRRAFPDARIAFLTFAENRELLAAFGLVDEVLAIRADSLPAFVADTIRVAWRLARWRVDLALDLETGSRFTALMTWLSGAPTRVGLVVSPGARHRLFTHPVVWDERKHISEAFCDVARRAGAHDTGRATAALTVPQADRERADELLAAAGVGHAEEFVAMNVNAGPISLERRWPQEHFAALGRWLLDNHRLPLVFIGTGAERPYVAAVLDGLGDDKRAINIAGETDVGCLLGVLARAKLLVTNDTGPMHLAAAVGTPTVSFFGPEAPERYGPTGEGHVVLRTPAACAPCLSSTNMKSAPCRGGNVCMPQIPVADAVAAVQRYL